jgi:hypothetical protein
MFVDKKWLDIYSELACVLFLLFCKGFFLEYYSFSYFVFEKIDNLANFFLFWMLALL